ncbi:MAG: hypothetical protein KKD01_13555 [Proteobacteria bacterium]|nr:hypothetical protein [Pseudomonadota bacterium]MBU1418929.1 hypothetical protein [Pseudomonadota bacterium]MBU1455746.1 hypothetical protein [Pseudomonadota bacterium]
MSKFNIYARTAETTSRVASITHDSIDGSIYLALVRENEQTTGYKGQFCIKDQAVEKIAPVTDVNKIVKVSYHTSGIINYHNLSNSRITSEPLYNIKNQFWFIDYLVNDLRLLTCSPSSKNAIFINLPEKEGDEYYRFRFFVSNKKVQNHIVIDFCSALYYLTLEVSLGKSPEKEKLMPFYYLTPSAGLREETDKINSTVMFHQKLNETNGIIIYEPNISGIYTIIYHEERRSIPKRESLIQLINSEHRVEFTSVKKHYAKFYIRNKHTGEKIIQKTDIFKGFLFDNRY